MSNSVIDMEALTGLASEGLDAALQEVRLQRQESAALLQAAQAIPMADTFAESARAIFDACCGVIGASAGYVALLSSNGEENEVLFLESGGRECTVDPNLPMPIRGLREVAYREHRAVYDNDFSHSKWMDFMPAGHVTLDNVLFSPIVVGNRAVGLIGIANKAGGFVERDAKVATTFGELGAVALRYARYQDQLRRWAHVFENAQWGVAVGNPENRSLEMLNPAFAEMHGYSVDDLASKPVALLVAAAEQAAWNEHLAHLGASGHCTFETEHVRRDGSRFPAQVDVTLVREQVEQAEGSHARDAEEQALQTYYVINVQDITERRAKDEILRRSNLELRQYAEVAAHHLQEPLRLISSYTQLLSRRYADRLDTEADEYIHYAVSGAERLQRLLQDLLIYSQVGGEATPCDAVDCEQLLGEVLEALGPGIQATEAELEHAPLPAVRGNQRELYRLFQHLLLNALGNAGNAPPRIRISAERVDEMWRFTVSDQGVGIAPRHQQRIFNLFHRLQGPMEGEGTGIGLALCKKIVEHHGGKIWVESEESQGARFHFLLPGV